MVLNLKKMSKIPIVKEFLKGRPWKSGMNLQERIHESMIEFAKLHVKEALKEASEKAEWKGYTLAAVEICNYSILDAYPLENIK